jgi:hypothetical protein
LIDWCREAAVLIARVGSARASSRIRGKSEAVV